MTHYDVDYSKMEENDRRVKAIDDIKEYVGEAKFDELNKMLEEYVLEKRPSLDAFRMTLFMFPVSGYPIKAWYETLQPS